MSARWTYKDITIDNQEEIERYAALRPIATSEGHFLYYYIWGDYFQGRYHVEEDFLCVQMTASNGILGVSMPFCRQDKLVEVFFRIRDYFNHVLQRPLYMYLIDKLSLGIMLGDSRFVRDFHIKEDKDSFDYIYDAEKLRSLSGKAYQKKKNHFNRFKREYEGRYAYRELGKEQFAEIMGLYDKWLLCHKGGDKYQSLAAEKASICKVVENCDRLSCKIGGVYIDGSLAAFSIGSYEANLACAHIYIEKADPSYKGLYTFINQQFLTHAFPLARYVNREDDMGLEGLRKAKLSWKPIYLAEKYYIQEKQNH